MCGLTGFWMKDSSASLHAIVEDMSSVLVHRGPDSGAVWVDEASGIGLGHRRLSILDLSSQGAQPMHSSCKRYVLVFNGEIYNHPALRSELDKCGLAPSWRGHSDTEVLLASFVAWGVSETLQRVVGMFSFVLWDKYEGCLTLARDRFGEKPLYYGWVNKEGQQSFLFGSELKALNKFPGFSGLIDRGALALYFQYCTVPSPYSIYQDVFKLQPGHILTLYEKGLKNKDVKIEPYWNLSDIARKGSSNPIESDVEAIERLDSVLRDSVAQQSEADVPLGAFLSGGVDSSTIVALMQAQSNRPIETFTIGFEDIKFDESRYAKAVAQHLGTNHHELYVTSDDALNIIPSIPELYDEPFSDSSQIPTYFVCKAARKKVTVALTGDGGDELFGGYNRHLWSQRIWNKLDWMTPILRRSLGKAVLQLPVTSWDFLNSTLPDRYSVAHFGNKVHNLAHRLKNVNNQNDLYKSLVSTWPQNIGLVLGAEYLPTLSGDTGIVSGINEPEQCMMLWDSLTYLPDDILTKVDRAAMGVSLETRVPFLDHRVAELAWRFPLHMKIRDGKGKWVLRQVLRKYVPDELIERPKAGFGVPVGQWLQGPLREWAEELLSPKRIQRDGYLDYRLIQETWAQHLSGRYDWSERLWSVLMFQSWLDRQY